MRLFIIILVLMPRLVSGQQNLVPNGSFEENWQCPGVPLQWTVNNWESGNDLTPDYYHTCGNSPPVAVPLNRRGYQEPNSGNAYVGVWAFSISYPEGREYIQVELVEPLYHSIRYVVSFYTSLAEGYGGYSIATMGAALTVDLPQTIHENGLLNANPQVLNAPLYDLNDTINWILITDTVVSRDGNERYLTIGNFFSDSDSEIALFNPNADQPELGYYYIDDVSVIALDSVPNGLAEAEQLSFSVYPNPVTDILNINGNGRSTDARLLDMAGREVLRSTGRLPLQMGIGHHLPKGLYFLEMNSNGRKAVQKVIVQ